MNNLLAQYLFNKEVIYKNPALKVNPEREVVVEKKEATPEIAPTPHAAPDAIIETPQVIRPIVIPLKLNHKVLIIAEVISEDEKAFLGKILGAVGLSLAQVDLIEIQKIQHIDYQSFIAQKVTTQFISFGVGLSKLNWDLMLVPYNIRNVSGIDFLLANDLGAIAADTTLKKNLWTALQKMFSK